MKTPRLAGLARLAAASLVLLIGAADAQPLPPGNVPGGSPPPGVQGPRPMYGPNDRGICVQLESALARLDGASNANPEGVRRYEDAINRQRFELDQMVVQARRAGCESRGNFFLFGAPRPPQCDGLNNQISRMRANLDRMIGELQNMRGGNDMNRDLQRRQLINSLAQNNCGPQYRQAQPQQQQRPRSLLEALFGGGQWREESTIDAAPMELPMSSTFRTLCVRTCDGYYFPISYATVPSRFGDDEQACHRMCPATETMLFTHRNPGEDIEQAVSTSGTPYSDLPTAFKYRQSLDSTCSCRAAGQSWAEALGVGRDMTLQRGDIIVTEERARQMSQPRQPLSKGEKGKAVPAAPADTAAQPREEPPPAVVPGDKQIRTVGPQFYPVQ